MRLLVFFLAAIALAFAGPAHAADTPTYAAPADWVVPVTGPLPTVDPATAWLLYDQQVLIEADKRSTYSDYAFQIASAGALREWNDLQFRWQPDRDDLIVHRIAIVRDGQTIDLIAQGQKLTVLRREQELENKSIDGMLTATAPIKDLRVGDTVRYSVTLVERSDVLAGNSEAIVSVVARPTPLAQGTLRVLWPKALPIHWQAFGKGVTPVAQDKGDFHILTLAQPVVKQDEMPADAPLRFHRPPAIEFSTFATWADLSRAIAPLYATKGTIQEGGELAAAIDHIADASADPKTRAALALRLVQGEIRYLYNGLANGNYVPQTPEQTWALRYGDCKAKTLLLLAALDRLGVAARPALVHSIFGDTLPGRPATLGAFDHVLVQATIDGADYWLDGTTTVTPVEDIADVPSFHHALPLTAAGHDLAALPTRPRARPDAVVDISYDQSAGIVFPPLFDLRFTVRGEMAAQIATIRTSLSPDQLRDMAQSMLGSYINDGQISARSIEIDDEKGTATIHASGIGNLSWTRSEPRAFLDLDGLASYFEVRTDRTRAAWRDIPVSGGNSSLFERSIRLKLPPHDGFTTEGDAQLDLTIVGIEMKRDAQLNGSALVQRESVWTSGGEVPADQLPAARAQATAAKQATFRIRAPENYPARIEEIAEAKKTRRFAPLLAAYQQAIDDDPQSANGYLNRSDFYEGIFEPKAAIADLDAALELQADADTYLRRAGLYFNLGDFAASLANVEQALALDPGSESALYSKAGAFAQLGRFDDALTLIDEQLAPAKDKRGWIGLKADILGKAGRAAEGAALLAVALVDRPGDPELLNDLCWLKGTRVIALDSALKDCTHAIELTDAPANALDSRGLVYFRLGRPEEARADLDAVLKLSPGMPSSLYMRGIMRLQAGDRAGGEADLALARLQVPQIDREYSEYGIKP